MTNLNRDRPTEWADTEQYYGSGPNYLHIRELIKEAVEEEQERNSKLSAELISALNRITGLEEQLFRRDALSTTSGIDEAESEEQLVHQRQVARKNDDAKIRFELLSVPALTAIAQVMGFGALKYTDNNWRNGFDWSRLYGAALRHLLAHMSGEDLDSESGLSHLAHAGCCIMFLLEHEACGLGRDDRYKEIRK